MIPDDVVKEIAKHVSMQLCADLAAMARKWSASPNVTALPSSQVMGILADMLDEYYFDVTEIVNRMKN